MPLDTPAGSAATSATIGLAQPTLPPAGPPPLDLATVTDLARTVVAAGVLPEHITTVEQAVAVILVGREMGIDPMLALRSIVLDRGKAIVAADLQLALWKRDGGHATWERNDVDGVALIVRHPNGDAYRSEFTQADAVRAGLWGRPGPWTEYPVAMLRARAITAALKAIGYAPTAGAYDDVSEELPRSRPRQAGARAVARPAGGGASPGTLAAIDSAIQELGRLAPAVGEQATAWYAAERSVVERSEAEAQRALRRLRRRLATVGTAPPTPLSAAPPAHTGEALLRESGPAAA